MANVILTKHLSTDDIMQILEKGFPNFEFKKKSGFLIVCNTGLSGKFNINVSGANVLIAPRISPVLALILVFTIIGIFAIIGMQKDPNALAMANYLKENQNNDKVVDGNLVAIIPNTCPHCKNPNTQKIRLCEWCGYRII